jgi:hypothetical protein
MAAKAISDHLFKWTVGAVLASASSSRFGCGSADGLESVFICSDNCTRSEDFEIVD